MKKNKSQVRAIAHLSGPMLVLAGPGSGKTSVIISRTEHLIKDEAVSPSNILVVTFSKAAARQMKERFERHTGGKYRGVTFGTFHGVFYGILKQAYGLNGSNILGDSEKYNILRELVNVYSVETEDENEFLEDLAREIGIVKSNRISLDNYYSGSCPGDVFRKIFKGYVKTCHSRRKLDFDDMLVYCYDLLMKREDICRLWQTQFQYLLVDEFQDINQIQYDIIKLLARPEDNLFVVGDDDQAIYHFRGARPELMLNFKKDYPDAGEVLLDTNYRSTNAILKSAGKLIGNNHLRYDKKLQTPNEEGKQPEIHAFKNVREESLYLIGELQRLQKTGIPYEQIALLFRTNMEAEPFINRLLEYNLPFQMRDTLPNIYEHWIARNMISYMKLAREPMDRADFLAVMNRPNRYLSREAVSDKVVTFEGLQEFYREKSWMGERLDEMNLHLKKIAKMTPYAAINYIRHAIGYEEYLQEYANYRKIKADELYEVLDRLQENAKSAGTMEEWFRQIAEYGRKLKEQAVSQQKEKEGITVSTLHSVKGLEYDYVYIFNVNEGSIPYRKAVLDAHVEEERRLFYVGMTRARKELQLCYVNQEFEKKREPSRFLGEVMK